MIAMLLLLAAWNRRDRGAVRGRVRLKLGPPLSWQSLAAVLGGFVAGLAVIGALAVGLEHLLERDGALYAMWCIPWMIPPLLPLARWGLDVAAPGGIEVEGARIEVHYGPERHVLRRGDTRVEESIAPAVEGGLWQVHIHAGPHPVVISAPLRGWFGVRALETLRAGGVPDAPRDPAGLPLLADLQELLALREALAPAARATG